MKEEYKKLKWKRVEYTSQTGKMWRLSTKRIQQLGKSNCITYIISISAVVAVGEQ